MLEIKDESFNSEIAEGVVAIDFWAPWCGPCKMLGPIFEEVSNEISGIKFFKMNVDNNVTVPQMLQVSSIPTIAVFKDGKLVDKVVGFRPKSELEQLLKKHI